MTAGRSAARVARLAGCALAAACLGDAHAARELERAADDLGLHGNQVLDAPRLRLALVRGDRKRARELLERIEAEQGWYSRGHGTSLATLITRLDAHLALGHRDQVEREATRLLSSPGLIGDIDRWVTERAIDMLAEQRALGRDLRFEINLSARTIGDEQLLD